MTALCFVDGMDKYGPTGNQNAVSLMSGDWSVTSVPAIVAPLSTNGYAVAMTGGTMIMAGTLPSSMTRIAGTFRFQMTVAAALRVLFLNGASNAFSITCSAAGAIELRTGGSAGTVITSGGSVAINTVHVLSFDVTIGASGAYAFYLDGAALISGTGNTANSQASINIVQLSSGGNSIIYDDLALFNPADAAYNSSVLTNNVVVETSFPTGDAQKQFTYDGNVVWPAGIAAGGVYSVTATTNAPGANQLFLVKVTPAVACTLNSVSCIPRATSGTAKFRGVAYADSSGSPGSLLSSGSEMTATTSGTTLTGPLTSAQSLAAGTSYWIGFITDTSVVLSQVDATTNLGRRIAATYTSGAPGSAGAMTTGQATWQLWGNCTGASVNWPALGPTPPLGTAASQIHSATVAQEDLYTFSALATTPSAIYGVAVKGFLAKSDSGARTVSLNMKSGSSDSTGSAASQAMSTTNQWQRSFFDVDPATGVAWTQSGLNAASSGVSVAS